MKLSWQQITLPALALGLLAVGAPGRAQAQAAIKIDGSSTVFPISEAYAEEFQIQKRGKVRVTVGVSGTGGGFKKFCRGETDMANASRPISVEEMEACRKAGIKYMEVPVAFDALTVVGQPVQHLGQDDDRRRTQEDVGAGRAGPHHHLEPGQPEVPEGKADAVRAGRRLGHVRLLHRGRERQGEGEPRRLHRQRRRQHAGAGRREQQERARLLRLRVLRGAQGQDDGRRDRQRQGPGRPRASRT